MYLVLSFDVSPYFCIHTLYERSERIFMLRPTMRISKLLQHVRELYREENVLPHGQSCVPRLLFLGNDLKILLAP